MKNSQTVSNRLIRKLSLTFFIIVTLMGLTYILTTFYVSKHLYEETSQKINSDIANHLIEEKFQNASPFLDNGKINKPFFGDIMHDMMAVNRSIEVYLVSKSGEIQYSVVLDHSNPNEPAKKIDLVPVKKYLKAKGQEYILGDDPRNPGEKKIFSVAEFKQHGHEGYIYIVLAGEAFVNVSNSLETSYYTKLGLTAFILTMIFAGLAGWLAVMFLTKNLREIIFQVNRFQEGDYESRIPNAEESDLSTLALTYNDMADTISKNIEEIKSVDVLRRELIANVSHDLRTPLAIMQGYIETIQMKKDELGSEETQKYIITIENSIKQLSRLVSQLFEYSKLEAKQIKPHKEVFPITDLVYDLHAKYSILTKDKNINLSVDVKGKTPLIFADISLVERAIQNLLDNAIKFTPENGNIALIIEHNKKQVLVRVKDDGPGINQEDQAHIFDRFKQGESREKQRGAGLGLAIVKKIIDLHEGKIQVISKPNEGSIFEFTLPNYSKA
ncbi:MAG: ATP-binding protein [Flavobacteriales bacterium]